MKIAPIIITCPERAQVFAQTLAYFRQTDWADPPRVQMDESCSPDHRARQTRNPQCGLEWFRAESDAEFALLLEDDLDFNLHLRWNLERWSPMVDRRLQFGSIYNPNTPTTPRGRRLLFGGSRSLLRQPGLCPVEGSCIPGVERVGESSRDAG